MYKFTVILGCTSLQLYWDVQVYSYIGMDKLTVILGWTSLQLYWEYSSKQKGYLS